MGSAALVLTQNFEEMNCGECGIVFWVPDAFYRERRGDGKGWSCPNGHSRVFRESDVARLERQLKEEKERHQRTLQRANEAEARETRLKRRVKDGTCPCCKRTFRQLARHMETKHPEFKP